MKRLLPFALTVLAIVSGSVLAGRAGGALQAVPGTIWGGNIAKAKDGYRFVRTGERQARVERISTSQIMGSYVCIAPKGGDSGRCNLLVNYSSIECQGIAANGDTCQLRPRVTARVPARLPATRSR